MSDVAETLDPLRLPLQGERLIEASAGTGKTFTIAALYLRLLLGLGGSAAFPRPLTVEELLVVTFTEAATAELRGRIRSNIHELRIACLRETTDNPLYERLLEEIDDKAQAAQWLLLAERQMDEAAVFTIHGFCQRMLNLNAFESGMLFEQQLIEDESLLRYQACADFWRRHCYFRCRVKLPRWSLKPRKGRRRCCAILIVICKAKHRLSKHRRPMMKRWLPATRKLWRVSTP